MVTFIVWIFSIAWNFNFKSAKAPFAVYTDLESLKKINGCKNNPGKTWTTKVSEHIPSGFPKSTVSPFKDIENMRVV